MKTLKISDEVHRRLRIEAVSAGVTLQELVTERLVGKVRLDVKPEVVQAKAELVQERPGRVEVTKGKPFMGAYSK